MKPSRRWHRRSDADRVLELPEAARARAAAYVITASEGGNHHLADLRSQADNFDPNTRSRFLAGALVPAAWVTFAQRFRSWYRERDARSFPASRCDSRAGHALSGDSHRPEDHHVNGAEMPSRPNIGVFTQPISFVGLPVVTVPVHFPGKLPIGVQLIGAPYQESNLLRVAWELQNAGVVSAPIAQPAGSVK